MTWRFLDWDTYHLCYECFTVIFNRVQGLHVRTEWVNEQLLQRTMSIHNNTEQEKLTEELFRQALFADFHIIGDRCLPPDVDKLHNVYLKGPFILQIDEMFNIAGTSDKRNADGSGRMLKIFATDGCHNVGISSA